MESSRLLRKNIFTNPNPTFQQESVPTPIPPSQPSVDIEKIATDAATKGATAALAAQERLRQQYQPEREEDGGIISWSPKTEREIAKTLFGTVIKKMSDQVLAQPEDPLKSVIGQISALQELMNILRGGTTGSVGGERSYIDKFLNSQFALGLGQGFGSNPKQVIESLGSILGPKQSQDMASAFQNYLAQQGHQGGGGGGGSGGSGIQQTSSQISNPINSSPVNPISPNPTNPTPQNNSSPQSGATQPPNESRDVLMTLDPNNPDHIAAYAETQGGIPIDIARKMMMIHQDAFHKQIEQELKTVDQINQIPPSIPKIQNDPFANDSIPVPVNDPIPVPPINNPIPTHIIPDPIPVPNNPIPITSDSNTNPPPVNNHVQEAILQIAHTMDNMMTRMEDLNNHVFKLQAELNDIRIINQPKQSEIQKDNINEVSEEEDTNVDIKWHDDVILSKVEKPLPIVEQPIIEKPLPIELEQPIVEQPVESKVIVEQPLPIVEQPPIELEQPIVEQPIVEQPLPVESKVEPIVEQPIVEQKIEDGEFIEITENEEEHNIELINEDDVKNIESEKIDTDKQENESDENEYKVGYRFVKKEEKIGRKLSKGEKLEKRIIKGKTYQVSIEGNAIKEIYDEQKELLIPLEKFFK